MWAVALSATSLHAQDRARSERPDRFTFLTHGETHAQLFRRALLPGANGATIATETALPITQYVLLSARDLDTPWQPDSTDIELSVWGRLALYDLEREQRLDGDVQTANVQHRLKRFAFRLGRQHVAGGAARYSRFDGVDASAHLGGGFWLEGYGGFTVMPRWNERPGFIYLGTASDSGIRNLATTPVAARDSLWLAGGRLGFARGPGHAVVSFHEQHEAGGLARRNLGAQARIELAQRASVGGSAILELDSNRFADASLFVDYSVSRHVDASLEYLHTEPALLLSRQSVLAVFSDAGYEEVGGSVRVRPMSTLTIQGLGFVNAYAGGETGGRGELSAGGFVDTRKLTFARLAFARISAPDNGYASLRASLSRRIGPWLTSTLEGYLYFYDRAIHGARTSSVYAATLTYRPLPSLSVLAGTSFARTPDARIDAQGQVRIACDFDWVRRTRGL